MTLTTSTFPFSALFMTILKITPIWEKIRTWIVLIAEKCLSSSATNITSFYRSRTSKVRPPKSNPGLRKWKKRLYPLFAKKRFFRRSYKGLRKLCIERLWFPKTLTWTFEKVVKKTSNSENKGWFSEFLSPTNWALRRPTDNLRFQMLLISRKCCVS
jgi:hypothetical protein